MEREEAIQVVRGLTETTYFDDRELEGLRTLIPELTESEDERIRKGLIDIFNTALGQDFLQRKAGLNEKEVIAYLEKQKEQEHPDGCFTCNEYKKGYEAGRLNGLTAGYNKAKKEQKPVEYLDKDKVYAIMTKLTNLSFSQLIPILSDEYKKIDEITSDVRSLLDYPIEQKPTWSEEDEDMLNSCISSIEEAKENRYAYKETDGDTSYDREINWLKSLRPSWKPSEEQIVCLERVIAFKNPEPEDIKGCEELLDQLKKL